LAERWSGSSDDAPDGPHRRRPHPHLRRVAAPRPPAREGPVFDFLVDVGPLAAPGLDFAALAAWLVEDPLRLGAVLWRLQTDPNRRPGELRDDFRAITEGSGVSPEDLARLVSSFRGPLPDRQRLADHPDGGDCNIPLSTDRQLAKRFVEAFVHKRRD
jgi:hypothetical protein